LAELAAGGKDTSQGKRAQLEFGEERSLRASVINTEEQRRAERDRVIGHLWLMIFWLNIYLNLNKGRDAEIDRHL
jgi:hypothetical protein